MKIGFYPEWDEPRLLAAAAEYRELWHEWGGEVVVTLERQTGLRFLENQINAIVFEGVSHSTPLRLRASYTRDVKIRTLVHELGHRLLVANGFTTKRNEAGHIAAHKLLNLFLFDAYVTLFGEDEAQKAVNFESGLRSSYAQCWRWALAQSKEERQRSFAQLKMDKARWQTYLEEPNAGLIERMSQQQGESTVVRVLEPHESFILNRVAPGVFDGPVNPSWYTEFFADSRHHLAVALDDGLVVGMASGVHYVHPDKAPELWVNEVGVAPSYQQQGLGKRLLHALFERARALGCREAWVLTESGNTAARKLYEGLGAEEAEAPVYFTFDLEDGPDQPA